MKRIKVSNNVIRRMPRYLRKLDDLNAAGIERISSGELGRQMGLTPSQIRQDFSCFGEFGQQGYGYNVVALRGEVAKILGMDRNYSAVLVGVGNIGRALVENFCFFCCLSFIANLAMCMFPPYFANGIPNCVNNSLASSSVLAVVTMMISIPLTLSTLSYSISGKISCSLIPSA